MVEVLFWIFIVGIVAQTIDSVLGAIRGDRDTHKDLMNTRVSSSGVRLGAMIDAADAKARGRTPTNWR